MLHLRHHPPRCLPTRCLVKEALVPDHWLVTRSSHWPRQQLRDVPLQAVIGRDANGILHVPLLQRLVDLRLGKGCVGPKHYFLAQLLLPLNLGQQKFCPTLGTVHVSGPQLCSQTVAFAAEQQQWVIAGGLEVPVVGALLLLPIHRNLGRVHVQHGSVRRIHRFRPGDQIPIDPRQPGEVLLLGQHLRLERLQPRSQGRPSFPDLL